MMSTSSYSGVTLSRSMKEKILSKLADCDTPYSAVVLMLHEHLDYLTIHSYSLAMPGSRGKLPRASI
uniref:Uncharacterized protein n=1 Tax=Arundo donax TaxID=35708 RepID=A0A0A9H5S9_ARUDO